MKQVLTGHLRLNYIRYRLRYDAESGDLFWRPVDASFRDHKRWNKRFAGKTAGCLSAYGYKVVTINNVQFKSHRIAWAIFYGRWPDGQIDHINGDRTDNRISNLRQVTPRENALNRKEPENNTSGYIGVSPTKYGTWVANVSTPSGRKYIGSFKCVTAAAVARVQAGAGIYHRNHGRRQ